MEKELREKAFNNFKFGSTPSERRLVRRINSNIDESITAVNKYKEVPQLLTTLKTELTSEDKGTSNIFDRKNRSCVRERLVMSTTL